MKVHQLKIKLEYAIAIMEGKKKFELRKNDRDYQVGDFIRFHLGLHDSGLCDELFKMVYGKPIDDNLYKIEYVLKDIPKEIGGLEQGYAILGIVPPYNLRDSRIKILAAYMVAEGCNKTTEGYWLFSFDKLVHLLPGISKNDIYAWQNEIIEELERYKQVSQACVDVDGDIYKFNVDYYFDYCKLGDGDKSEDDDL